MYTAAQEQFGNNPFAQLLAGNGGMTSLSFSLGMSFFCPAENTAASRTENTDPLPNPWASRGGTGSSTAPSRQQTQATPAGDNTQQQQQATASAIPTGTAGSSPGLISPMMQNYMSQLVQNPRLLESVLNAPYMQPLMDSLAANPDISRQMITNNPMFANNPELREHMLNALPAMMDQMRNPEVQALMQNREALEAITQVQEGLKINLHYSSPFFLFRTSTITYSSTKSLSSVRFFARILELFNLFLYSSGGLPAGLRITPTGITSPANANTSTSQPTDTNRTGSSNDPNNYAGVFAQMLNMMSNQNIVCSLE